MSSRPSGLASPTLSNRFGNKTKTQTPLRTSPRDTFETISLENSASYEIETEPLPSFPPSPQNLSTTSEANSPLFNSEEPTQHISAVRSSRNTSSVFTFTDGKSNKLSPVLPDQSVTKIAGFSISELERFMELESSMKLSTSSEVWSESQAHMLINLSSLEKTNTENPELVQIKHTLTDYPADLISSSVAVHSRDDDNDDGYLECPEFIDIQDMVDDEPGVERPDLRGMMMKNMRNIWLENERRRLKANRMKKPLSSSHSHPMSSPRGPVPSTPRSHTNLKSPSGQMSGAEAVGLVSPRGRSLIPITPRSQQGFGSPVTPRTAKRQSPANAKFATLDKVTED